MTNLERVVKLEGHVERAVRLVLECQICGYEFRITTRSGEEQTEREFAADAFRMGWRYLASKKLECYGPICPTCHALPASQR